jgi:CheY-like chemotaxis protein
MSRILLCDNEQSLRTLMRASLDGLGHEVHEATTGDEGVRLARELHPDLVLLDMMMPGRTGLDVLHELRADPALAEITVVMVTARVQVDDREAALAAGADGFLSKPFKPAELVALVSDLLGDRSA